MVQGIVFDIQEFCVHDGPGPRTTVFLKGCPMRCNWCHNPEGLSLQPQIMRSQECKNCGVCQEAEELLRKNLPKEAMRLCPYGYLRVIGSYWEAGALAATLKKQQEALSFMGGGITLSGGECLLQSSFTTAVLRQLTGMHRAIQTSGYAPLVSFQQVVSSVDLVLFDLKLMDPTEHLFWTGKENTLILANLNYLLTTSIPFIARIPLIPGVTTTKENITAIARSIRKASHLVGIELMRYNQAAGAKYKMIGEVYSPQFIEQETTGEEIQAYFHQLGFPSVTIL